MSNINDEKILKLKEQIKEKKSKLSEVRKFNPVTNCILELDGEKLNIRVLQKDQLISLAVKLNSYIYSAKSLGLLKEYFIGGCKAEDWLEDVKFKIDETIRKEEERKLKIMEDKLNKLLSEDKKVELELSEIESWLE